MGEQILAMQPGREMDVAIAERVMGWTNIITQDEYGGVYVGWPPDGRPWDTDRGAYIPRYSHDDAAALRIIPAMAKRGWDWAGGYEGASAQWSAYFMSTTDENSGVIASGNSLSEAVSKAALLALLKEVDAK